MNDSNREASLEAKIRELEAEIAELQKRVRWPVDGETVRVPEPFKPLFDVAQETVRKFFSDAKTDPTKATIKISGERYVLLRASSLSVDFLTTISQLYSDYGEDKAFAIGRSFLFDISHVIGIEDAKNFHRKMGVTDPIAKLSSGPVHFAYSGWAFVDISPESSPSPDENYFMKYDHPFSFEADSWIKAGRRAKYPVCIMNCGYSSGWCEESFGMPLTAVEISCKAAGDDSCTFIMAPPEKIEEHLARFAKKRKSRATELPIPSFFERKKVDEEMTAARIKAEESDRIKSAFLANVSHEIRTPMNGVLGMIDLTLDTKLSESQRNYLLAAHDSAESLMAIINEVLDFSKFEAEGLVLEAQPFELRHLLEETMIPFQLRGQSKGLAVNWNVAEDVSDSLIGDEGRLRQVIVNLVGNAIKFTQQGSVDLNVASAAEQPSTEHSSLQFTIRDTGIGIPTDKLDSIFDAFTQADVSTTRRYGGTGLGLTISTELVRLMNGRIWCENNPEEGASFHFLAQFEHCPSDKRTTIPSNEVSSGPTQVTAPESEPNTKLNILLAEDNQVNQMLALALLKKLGHTVTVANDGNEAVQLWQDEQNDFDLILMDVLMPEKDGIQATQVIRELEQESNSYTPIIAVTAQAMKGDREFCLEAGMDAYLSKPIRIDQLRQVLQQFSKKT